MAVAVKICGLREVASLDAAIDAGAAHLGFVFYPPSPRSLDVETAAGLARRVPRDRNRVGVLVDPDDRLLAEVLAAVPLDLLQIHGATPLRLAEIKARTGRKVIGALSVGSKEDLAAVAGLAGVADMLLFDARPPDRPDQLPGGNATAFDWRLLDGLEIACPWLLAGGLDETNLADAVRLSGARAVDVSSGVELTRGVKDASKIRRFLALAATLP